jgi:hypothetical protein
VELRIPITRSNFFQLIAAALSALIGRETTMVFDCDKVNGKEKPMILSRGEVVAMQQENATLAANAQILREITEEALEQVPPELEDHQAVKDLRAGLRLLDKRVLH